MITARTYGLIGPIGAHEPRGSITSWRKRIVGEDTAQRRACCLCLGVGLLLQLVVPLAFWAMLAFMVAIEDTPRPGNAASLWLVSGIACGLMLLLAIGTKPDGRAEAAQQVMNEGVRASMREGGGVPGVAAVLLLLIALYGSFAIVEAVKRMWIRRKLRHVNRFDAARVLSLVAANPVGLPAKELLHGGQTPQSLRGSIALLLLDGWVDLRDGCVVLRSPSMRRLSRRHPLADVFESVAV